MRLDELEPGARFEVIGCPALGTMTLVKVWAGCCRIRYGGGGKKEVTIPEAGSKPARTFIATDYGTGTEFSRGTPVTLVGGAE